MLTLCYVKWKLDPVALVTGSTQGIGQGIVLRLGQEGANVIINYRSDLEALSETLAKVQAGSTFFVDGGLLWNYHEQ